MGESMPRGSQEDRKIGTYDVALAELDRVEKENGRQQCILLVDDNEMMVEMAKTMLEQFGYIVFAATDSIEAFDVFMCRPHTFDLVITDHIMPKMKGTELAEAILKVRPGIPILLCTGYSGEVSPEQAKEVGIQGYLLKPFSLMELSSALDRILPRPSA